MNKCVQVSQQLTQTLELKGSCLKQSRQLEEAAERHELLMYQKTDLENQVEVIQVCKRIPHKHKSSTQF